MKFILAVIGVACLVSAANIHKKGGKKGCARKRDRLGNLCKRLGSARAGTQRNTCTGYMGRQGCQKTCCAMRAAMKNGGLDNGGARPKYTRQRHGRRGGRGTSSRRNGFFSRERDHFRRRGGRTQRGQRGQTGRTGRYNRYTRGRRTGNSHAYGREDRERRRDYNPRNYGRRTRYNPRGGRFGSRTTRGRYGRRGRTSRGRTGRSPFGRRTTRGRTSRGRTSRGRSPFGRRTSGMKRPTFGRRGQHPRV